MKYYSNIRRTQNPNQIKRNQKNSQLSIKTLIKKNTELQNQLADIKTLYNELESKAFESEVRVGQAELRAGRAELRAGHAEERASRAEERIFRLEEKWLRFTRIVKTPIRAAKSTVKIFKKLIKKVQSSLISLLYIQPKKILRHILLFIQKSLYSHPGLKRKVLSVLNHFPSLKNKLKKSIMAQNLVNQTPYQKIGYDNPSPRTHHIYLNLKNVIEQQKETN